MHQRRASRIAYQYLRDAAEADEAVQDAFVKVFSHIASYREAWPFEVWFTRILINGCLDRRKARARRDRWFVGGEISSADEARVVGGQRPATDPGAPAARARAARAHRRGDRPARRPAADGLHAVPLRRLHAAGGQRDDRPERIDRSRPSVPRRAQAARPAGRPSRDALERCAPSPGRTPVRRVSGRARQGEPVDPPVAEHLADCGACGARYAELVAVHGRCCARKARPKRTPSSRPSGLRHSSSRSPAASSTSAARRGSSAFPAAFVRRTMTASAVAHRRRAGSPPRPPRACSSASRSARHTGGRSQRGSGRQTLRCSDASRGAR